MRQRSWLSTLPASALRSGRICRRAGSRRNKTGLFGGRQPGFSGNRRLVAIRERSARRRRRRSPPSFSIDSRRGTPLLLGDGEKLIGNGARVGGRLNERQHAAFDERTK